MGYYTPEQAGEKMCPFMTQSGRSYAKCIVDHCMLWRWEDGIGPGDVDPPQPETVFKGYCGMAGHPGQDVPKPKSSSASKSPKMEMYAESDRPAAMAEKAIEGTA